MPNSSVIEQINMAIHAHGPWKLKLAVAVETGTCDLTPETACKDDCCDFGKWIHGSEIPGALRSGVPYQVIRRLHAEFHQCAGDILTMIAEQKGAEADALLHGEFSNRSHNLVVALNKWKRELEMDQAA